MGRSLAITSVAAAAVIIAVSLCGIAKSEAPAPAPAPATSADHRYSAQMVMLPGLLGPAVTITDHQEQKLFFYTTQENVLELSTTIDLSKAGQPAIELQKAPKPATRPAGRGQ